MMWKVGVWGRPGSNSHKIASHVGERVHIELADFFSQPGLAIPEGLVIVSPNYGDAEVPEDIEKFLINRSREINKWVVLEIGNYGGFDDWSFGARERIGLCMKKNGLSEEALPGVGLDTLPRIDWGTLDRWCDTVLKPGVDHVQ